MIEPTPTRDWAAIQRVLEDFERDGGEDDAEVSDLTRRHAALVAQATPRQDVDHVSETKLPALSQAPLEGGRSPVSAARSAVRVDRPDVPKSLPAAAHDISPHGSGRRVQSEVGVPQRNDDNEKQPRARENTVAAHVVPQAPNLSEKDAKMANDPTILDLPIGGSMHGTTTLTEERELVEQPTTNYLPIGVSVHSTTTLAQECAKVEQPRMAHVPYDSNIHAAPMVSKERQNGEPRDGAVPYIRTSTQRRWSAKSVKTPNTPSLATLDWRFGPGRCHGRSRTGALRGKPQGQRGGRDPGVAVDGRSRR